MEMQAVSNEPKPTGRPHKSKVRRRDGRDGESPDIVLQMSPRTPLRSGPFLISVDSEPDYVLEIEGSLISKKNSYSVGRRGMYKGEKIKACEQMVAIQIPVFMRGLELEHPHFLVERRMPKFNRDRDNGYTFLLDCLVTARVIKDDSTSRFNGCEIHVPVRRHKKPMTRVHIWRSRNDQNS